MSWDCGLRYMFSVSPALQQGSKCILHDKEDLSRLEMVQKLAKDGCRLLQNHNKGPERTSEVRCTRLAATRIDIFFSPNQAFQAKYKCTDMETVLEWNILLDFTELLSLASHCESMRKGAILLCFIQIFFFQILCKHLFICSWQCILHQTDDKFSIFFSLSI